MKMQLPSGQLLTDANIGDTAVLANPPTPTRIKRESERILSFILPAEKFENATIKPLRIHFLSGFHVFMGILGHSQTFMIFCFCALDSDLTHLSTILLTECLRNAHEFFF